MKKLATMASVIALAGVLAGCHWLGKAEETAASLCAREAVLHTIYMTWIAPERPADKVQKAVAFHTKVQALCATGADIIEILKAHNEAASARQ